MLPELGRVAIRFSMTVSVAAMVILAISCSSSTALGPDEAEGDPADVVLEWVDLGDLQRGSVSIVWSFNEERTTTAVVPSDRLFEEVSGSFVPLDPGKLEAGDSVRVWIRRLADRGGLLRLSTLLRLRPSD